MLDAHNMDWNICRVIKSDITLEWQGFWKRKSKTFTVYNMFPITISSDECMKEANQRIKDKFYKNKKYDSIKIISETFVPQDGYGWMIYAQS